MSDGPGTPASEQSTRQRQIVLPAAIAGLAIAAGLGVLRFALSEPPERSVEWLGDLALAAVYAVPAVLALVGLRGRPSLLAAGGVLGIALAFTAFSGVALVLVVPSALYLVGYGKAPGTGAKFRIPPLLVLLLTLALGVGALFVLFAHNDPICWAVRNTAAGKVYVELPASEFQTQSGFAVSSNQLPPGTNESGCSSDTIRFPEALASFGLALAAVVAGALGAGARSNRTSRLAYGAGAGPIS